MKSFLGVSIERRWLQLFEVQQAKQGTQLK